MEPIASIVIPTYNAAKTIANTIEACLGQNFPKDKLEIIIADDGSTDNTGEIVRQYPVVQYLNQENKGPAAARNLGWNSANGEIICFTDSDCVPEKDWLSKIVAKYIAEDIGGVGGSYDIQNTESLLARCIHEEIIQRHRKFHSIVDFLGSFNVSYRKKVLQKVGGFDTSFRDASGEDNDLSYKVRKAGYKLIFDSDIKVGHFHTTKLFNYLREQYRHGYWRIMLYKIHPEMVKGDEYAGVLDFIQPPLAMVVVGLFLISFFYPLVFFAFCFSIAFLLILQLPTSYRAVIRNRQYSYLYLVPILFLRAFARGLGMLKGILRFFILNLAKK